MKNEEVDRQFFILNSNFELRTSIVIALYAVLSLLVIPVFPHFPSPNELTRWALVVSVVEHGTIEVSRAAALLGPQFEDLAAKDGRLYSNKAPGAALVAAPGYLLVRPFIGPPSRENLRAALTAMRWCGATLPLLAMLVVFARAGRAAGGETAFAVAAAAFATPLFVYGLLLFSHALVAAALFGAWALLYVEKRLDVVAGALIGIAVASEYPIVIAGAVLVAGLLNWKRIALVCAGGAPFAVLLAVYHKSAFGGVAAVPALYEKHPAFRELAHTGFFSLQIPDVAILTRILFDPGRGLLLFAPVLLAALFALPAARRALPRPAFLTLVLVPLAIVAVYGGYPNWHGGWNVGPRYIVSAIPFLAFPLVFAASSRIAALLFGASLAAVIPISLTFPFPDRSFALPWATLGWPLLGHGLVAPNLFHLIAGPLAIAVPFALVAAAVMVAARRRVLFVVAGIAIMTAASAVYVRLHPPDLTQRLRAGYVEEVYFERSGAMQRALPPGAPVPARAQARVDADRRLPPTSWPF
jgi:hypothetical protein